MRTFTLIALGALALIAGCQNPSYDELMAANRRMDEQLKRTQATLQELRQGNQALSDQLASCRNEVQARQQDIALLEQGKSKLQQSYDQLAARYERLVKQGGDPGEIKIDFPPLPARVNAALAAFAKANPDMVEFQAKHGMIKLKSDLTFDKGSDIVGDSARKALAKFVEIMNTAEARGFHVFVAGHTDNIPIKKPSTLRRHPNNWYLSVHRAVAVQQILQASGMAPGRLCAMGFGEHHPIEPNAPGQKGNPANRRVELWVVPSDRFLTPASRG